MDDLHASATKMGGGLGKIAAVVAGAGLAIGAGLAAGVGVGIKAAGDLEQAVANISTIKPSIDTSAVFASLNEMQTRVPQDAAQLGEALYNVFSSVTVSQEEGLALVEKFAKGAAGAQTDAATFGTAAMGVMNAYGMSVAEADHISDVFFNTVAAGVVSGEQLAAGLGPVTASAKAAGVSLDTLGGLMVGVTLQGGDAAQNLNNLNNMLMKVTTEPAQKAMKDMGVAVVDAAGNFREMPAILGDLKEHLSKLTQAEAAAAMQEIFPDAQARAGAQTIIDQLDKVNEAIEVNKTTAGSTDAAYKKMSGTFNSQMKLMQNTGMSILTKIGAEILPTITPLLVAFRERLPAALAAGGAAFAAIGASLATPIQVLKDSFGTIQQVFAGQWAPDPSQIDPFTNRVGELAIVLRDQVIPAVQAVAEWFGSSLPPAIASAQAAFSTISGVVSPIMADLKSTFDSLTSIFRDQIPPAAGEAASGVNLLSVAFGLISGAVQTMLAPIGLAYGAFKSITAAAAEFSTANQQALAPLGAAFQQATAAVGTALAPLVEIISGAINQIESSFAVLSISGDLGGFFTNLVTMWRTSLAAFGGLIMSALAPVGEAIGGFFSSLGTMAQAGVQGIGDAFSALGSTVQAIISAAGATIIGAWESVVDAPTRALLAELVAAVGDLFGAMGALVGVKMSELGTLVNTGWTAVSTFTSSTLAAIGAAVEAGWTAITTAVSTAMTAILAAVTPGWTNVQTSTDTANNAVKTLVETIWNGLSGAIGSAMNAVASTVTGAWNGIKSSIDGILAGLVAGASSFGSGMVKAFGDGIKAGLQGVLETVRKMTSDIRDMLPHSDAKIGPLSDLTASGMALPETFARGILAGSPILAGAMDALLGPVHDQLGVVGRTKDGTGDVLGTGGVKSGGAIGVGGSGDVMSPKLQTVEQQKTAAASTEQASFAQAQFAQVSYAEALFQTIKSIGRIDSIGSIYAEALNVDTYTLGAKAGGGSVSAGRPYLVGERGPEVFAPGSDGTIVPNNALVGGGNTYSLTINTSAPHEPILQDFALLRAMAGGR